jgi:hypothetical protein
MDINKKKYKKHSKKSSKKYSKKHSKKLSKKYSKKYSKKLSKKHSKKHSKKLSRLENSDINDINDMNINYGVDYNLARQHKNDIISKIKYPFLKYSTSPEKIKQRFINLINFKPQIIHEPYKLSYMKFEENELKYLGEYTLMIDDRNEYDTIELISDYFNEQCRIDCKFFTARGTPHEYFINNFDDIISHLEKNNQEINIINMRDAIWQIGNKACSTFKPKLIKYFIELYGAKRILDISSGWGDRLIGAMASNIECYHGFDPNPCLHIGYKNMIKFFSDVVVNPKAEFIIKELKFENAQLENNYYDLVMTSPPYFIMEIYVKNTLRQSERSWYENYLKVWINKTHNALKVGGILALNIYQLKRESYIYWLLDDMKKDNKWEYLGMISHSKINKKNPQPTFIWKKI